MKRWWSWCGSRYNGLAIHKWVLDRYEIFYSIPLFNGLQISRFDPFCLEMIRSDHMTITIS
jgi:hypothetical protein